MKVKVGGIIFDSETQPIMIVLSPKDKENIANMLPECTKYCSYPDDGFEYDEETIKKFMDVL
jgi:hypothetical protein